MRRDIGVHAHEIKRGTGVKIDHYNIEIQVPGAKAGRYNSIDHLHIVVDKNTANWAAHVLWTNIKVIDEILSVINKETLIKNCLTCYSVDFSSQPGCNCRQQQ